MSEAWCTDLAPVGTVRAVGDQVYTHLALGRLDSTVCLPRGDRVALAKELWQVSMGSDTSYRGTDLEVVDQGLHALLHGSTWRWYKLIVVDLDRTSRHLVQTLRGRVSDG